MKRALAIGCLSILGLLLLAVIGLTLGMAHLRRTAPPWPARVLNVRLEPADPVLREADVKPDNAYYYLRQLAAWTNAMRAPEEWERFKALGCEPQTQPVLDAWVASHTPALELCRRAAALTNCQAATITSAEQTLPHISPLMAANKMLAWHAERSARYNDWATAGSDLRTVATLGEQISRSGTLIHRLVGSAGGSLACRSARRIALTTRPPAEFLREVTRTLQTTEDAVQPFSETMRYEWLCTKGTWEGFQTASSSEFREIAASRLGVRPWWLTAGRAFLLGSPETSQQHLEAIYSHLIAAADAPPAQSAHLLKEPTAFLEDESKWHWLAAGDILGRTFLAITMPAIDRAMVRLHAYRATLRGTQLFLAVCAFRQEHGGQLPQTLEELVPVYLPQLPADPFAKDGRTFRYRVEPNRWVIYSLGPNGADDGGQFDSFNPEDRQKKNTDLLFASDEFDQARARYLEKEQKKPASD